MRRPHPVGLALVVFLVALLLLAGYVLDPGLVLRVPSSPWGPEDTHIGHIVLIDMENHAFDNYFGTYCLTLGADCPSEVRGEPPGICVPNYPGNLTGPCTAPYPLGVGEMGPPDMPHTYPSTIGSIANGTMSGFYQFEGGRESLGYYNATEIPVYWDMAEEYGLGDNFFSSALSYSLPNHWYLISGQSPPNAWTGPPAKANYTATRAYEHVYLNQANATTTVEDLLNDSPQVSWKYYDWSLPTYQEAINAKWGEIGGAYDYWNPLAARAISYTQWYTTHFVSRDLIFQDAENGTLPDLSYVIPFPTFSDHPPANVSAGQSFIAQVVDAIEEGPDWSSTAILITWDDYGGFYDGVAPPKPVGAPNDQLGLSIRVPIIVISPYTPEGTVVHGLGYFESMLHFIEWRFGLPCITTRDCDAPNLFEYFDFNQTARPPILFPTAWANASYPMPLQGGTEMPCPSICTIDPQNWNTDAIEGTANYTETEAD